jgi:hypothetical protein
MAVSEIEEFAKLLMQHVRDSAIASCDILRNPDCNSVDAKRWRKHQQSGQTDDLLGEVIPDCVDTALFYLLDAIDEGVLQISFKSSSGRMVDLVEEGESEMAGWSAMGGTAGWRARFSKERFNDD